LSNQASFTEEGRVLFVAKVLGTVVATVKHEVYQGRKVMVVQPVDLHGNYKGDSMLAVDEVRAGVGDTVLVLNEGASARQVVNNELAPLRAVIMGVVDHYGADI
jgi:microcompartment protein CcmK/EutM